MPDVMDQLVTVARALDAEAPPVTVDEVTGESLAVGRSRARSRRGSVAWLALGAAAVTLLVVVVAAPGEDRVRTSPPTAPAPAATTAPPVTAATTAANPTAPGPSVAPAPSVVALDEVAPQIAEALTRFTSFRAMRTQREYLEASDGAREDLSTQTGTVTLFNDGTLWIANEDGTWSAYDPSTATGRLLWRDRSTGAWRGQEVVGLEDASLPISMTVGHDPVPSLETASELTVTTTPDRRPAWQTTTTDGAGGSTTLVIDQATGLVVSSRQTYPNDDGRSVVRETTFEQIETDVDLPPEFPGVFPPDVTVERSGDLEYVEVVSLGEAAATFGRGLLQPAAAVDARTTITTSPLGDQARTMSVTTVIHDGFRPTTITQRKTVLEAGVTNHQGLIPFDDGSCYAPNGTDCATSTDPVMGTIESGPLAGMVITSEGDGSALAARHLANDLIVIATTPDLAWNTLVDLVPVS